MMETLTDFATVQYFGVQTVSVAVYKQWKGSYDFNSATQLSVLVLLFAVAVLGVERLLRGRARYTQRGGRSRGLDPVLLTGAKGWLATGACVLALGTGFVLPVLRLLTWAVGEARTDPEGFVDPRFPGYLVNSLTVAALASVACVAVSLLVGHALRMTGGRFQRSAAQLTVLGYAVPGAVVGIGVPLAFADLDALVRALGVAGGTGLLITGSVAGILYAYLVRLDRKSVVSGKSVDLGGRRIIKKKRQSSYSSHV